MWRGVVPAVKAWKPGYNEVKATDIHYDYDYDNKTRTMASKLYR